MTKKVKKPFAELMGTRIAIENFAKEKKEEVKDEKSKILLLPEDQKAIDVKTAEEDIAQTQRFRISQVGEECNDKFKEGQEVYIENPERVLAPANAVTVIEDGKIIAFIIPERAIAGIF